MRRHPGRRLLPFNSWWRRRTHRRKIAKGSVFGYAGARVHGDGSVPVISPRQLSSRAFFNRFVARRQPVVISGLLPELAKLSKDWWAPEAAKALTVQAEVRDSSKDHFGRGRRGPIRFGQLLDLIDAGATSHYMTTQEIADGELIAPPLTAIEPGVLPLQPKLLRTLCPQSINMWLGRSDTPASSGLHHDFHDNLYALLRGTKRFRLFSPADAPLMQTVGTISKVHPNGRINYAGEEPTAADGRTVEDAAADKKAAAMRMAKKARLQAEQRLHAAEEAEAAASDPETARAAARAVQRAEAALDAAMDELMGEEAPARTRKKRSRLKHPPTPNDAAAISSSGNGGPSSNSPPEQVATPDSNASDDSTPSNFSRLGALQMDSKGRPPPALAHARMAECEVSAGEMLYLPAGWFHEVSSHGGEHCALNYWFHPPDRTDYEQPYSKAGFWRREWREVQARTLRAQKAMQATAAETGAKAGKAKATANPGRRPRRAPEKARAQSSKGLKRMRPSADEKEAVFLSSAQARGGDSRISSAQLTTTQPSPLDAIFGYRM